MRVKDSGASRHSHKTEHSSPRTEPRRAERQESQREATRGASASARNQPAPRSTKAEPARGAAQGAASAAGRGAASTARQAQRESAAEAQREATRGASATGRGAVTPPTVGARPATAPATPAATPARPAAAPATPAAAPAAPAQPEQKNWLGEFGMGVADAFGVSHLFQKETWTEAGQGLNMLVQDPGRAASIIGEEFKNNIGDPAMRGLNYAIQNPSGAATILKDEAVNAAQSFKTNIIDKSIAGARLLFTDPARSVEILADSPRELGQIAGTAAGVALDAASGGSTRVARTTVTVAEEAAETAISQGVRQLTPNPGALVNAAVPNTPAPGAASALAHQADAVPTHLPTVRPDAPVPVTVSPRPAAAAATPPTRPNAVVSFGENAQLGDIRIGDVAGRDVVNHRAQLPVAGRPASEIADAVASQHPAYTAFTHPGRVPVEAPRGPVVSFGPRAQAGDVAFGDVVGGSVGKFEFDMTRGAGGPVPGGLPSSTRPSLPARTPPVPQPELPALPNSSVVRFGEGTQIGDVSIGDVVGGNKVHLDLNGPAALNDPSVRAAADDLMQTLSQHAGATPSAPTRPSVIEFGPESQLGDVSIGDVVGGNKLAVRVKFPTDVTPAEAVEILNGVRQGLEQAYQLGELNARVNTLRFLQIPN